jgi:hypothetical protein
LEPACHAHVTSLVPAEVCNELYFLFPAAPLGYICLPEAAGLGAYFDALIFLFICDCLTVVNYIFLFSVFIGRNPPLILELDSVGMKTGQKNPTPTIAV